MDSILTFVLLFIGCIVLSFVLHVRRTKALTTTLIPAAKKELQTTFPEQYALWVMLALEIGESELDFRRISPGGSDRSKAALIFGGFEDQIQFAKKHGLYQPANASTMPLPLEQSDVDFLAAYKAEHPSITDQKPRIKKAAQFILESNARVEAMRGVSLPPNPTNAQLQQMTFGKKKQKSAAGAMVKGAVVGKLIGGDAGAVVGAMVAKENHDSKKE